VEPLKAEDFKQLSEMERRDYVQQEVKKRVQEHLQSCMQQWLASEESTTVAKILKKLRVRRASREHPVAFECATLCARWAFDRYQCRTSAFGTKTPTRASRSRWASLLSAWR
jgi:adenosyl cobinamide kinase/adenosyl cobinamide phosphate guanylyltransferase